MGSGSPSQQQSTTDTSGKSVSATTGSTTGTTASTQNVGVPDWLLPFVQQGVGTAGQGLQDYSTAISNYQLPPETLAGLSSTAQGDYLYGGPAQQAYIDASVRAALPNIESQFEMAGRGGGGLMSTAIAQQAQDAFARLFDAERNRQQAAQIALPGISTLPIELQQQLISSASGLPAAFSSLFGQNLTGTSASETQQKTKGKTSGTEVQTTPVYQPPWWQVPLALGAAGIGLATPGLGGVSAGSNILSGISGLLGTSR